jgi:very-short-patch-repair endonuclease
MKRPYINSTITDLESIFHANCKDRDILKSLKDELMLRSSNRAQALRDNVDKLLEHPMNVTEKTSAPTSALLARLKPLREKLIDVSLRSRLLNYRDLGSQTLPLRPCDLDTLYQWLVASEKELEVEGVPKGESKDDSTEPPADEAQPPPTRLSVDFSGEDATQDVEDGTLRSRDSMLKTENRMTALFRKYRECLDAFGSNLCFMAFGFLEWTDPKRQDDEKRYAPLILVPVALSKVKREVAVEAASDEFELENDHQPTRRGSPRASRPALTSRMMAYRFTVKYDGEDIADNVALRLKLESLPGQISLPSFDAENDDASVEEYLENVERAIRRLPPEVNTGWKVVRGARLAFFSSAKEAMYRDLDPAKWPTSGLVSQEWIQAALDGRDQDTTPSVTDDEVTSALHINPVPTVLETDGSQMRAIVRVLRGDPMVIQGPPGTGKSQTITNLIAATLAKGKSVLFVAEKMAALSVVRQRMEESGLGRYCLELHSAKATPRQVIDQVKKRLAHQAASAAPASQLSADRQRLNQHRIALGNYGASIHHMDNSLESSFHDAVWSRSQLLDALEELLAGQDIVIDSMPALSMSREAGYAELSTLIDALKVAGRCIVEGVHLAAQPWLGSCPRELPGPHMEEAVRRTLGTAKQAALNWQQAECRLPLPDEWSAPTADHWIDLNQRFQPGPAPELPECMCHELAADFTSLSRYEEYIAALSAWRMPQPDEARALSENSGIDKATIEQARAAAEQIERTLISRMPHVTLEDLSDSSEQVLWLRNTLATRTSTLTSLAELIHVPITDETFSAGSRLAAFGSRLAQTSASVWRCLDSALLHPSSLTQLTIAKSKHSTLKAERDAISAEVRLDDLPDAATWSDLSRELRLTSGGWFNWLPGTRGNKLRKQLRACFLKRSVNEAAAMVLMDRAQNWRADAAKFAASEDAKSLLGPAFSGMETDWGSLDAAASLVADWVKQFGVVSAQEFISEHKDAVFAHSSVIASLAAQCEAHMNEWMALSSTLFQQDEATLRQLSTQTLSKDVSTQVETAASLVKALAELKLPPTTLTDSVPHLCSVALTLREHAATVSELTAKPTFLGDWHQGLLATDLQRIANAIAWLRQIIDVEALPHALKVWAFSASTVQRVLEVAERVQTITKAIDGWREAMSPLAEVFVFDSYTAPMSQNNLGRSVGMILSQLDAAMEAVPSLLPWYHLHESERAIEQAGGKSLWEWCREHHLKVEAIEKAAQLGFSNQFIEQVLAQHPELKTYHRQKLEEHRDGFRSLDKRVLNSFQKEVDRSIYRPVADATRGNRMGAVRSYTEMALLNHLASPNTRSMPVRRIIAQSSAALKCLMPCWMMGPQAVAQFLEPEKVEFDLLIIDEASQVRPEDALGSLARAKQIVIVGDSRQMPPTDVFQALGVHDEDDEVEDEDGEMIALDGPALKDESILNTFGNQLPAEMLLWHYRSQHQSLIAFSNENFYDSKLVVPPSRWHANDDLGIVRHFLETGRLQDRKNPAEATKAVEIMREHVLRESQRHEDDRETLGVVAMNAVQQDLISERWEKACKDDPDLEGALTEFTSKTSLFIRNLENVQGDERDVILISTTYGKNAAGEMHQRFGPVNKAGGWRRLNVLFTRARKRIHLVTSMVHSDVQQDTKQAESGRTYLRKYLQYAETGHLPDSGTAGFKGTPDSGFEESVARNLLGLGYEFHYQVGVQGFFIDIGVIHPDQPGQYLCGIECDGAAYHSHPIARDRDRIRQEILENRGWKIFRIWSTDWYRNRKLEIERLHAYLRQRSGGDTQKLD